jgi:predicted  nucleic acid-binding Zn-ribbon protein|tara:strand:+ start:346 stop:579 length:234 start_codon:yes stop_codon:yes gene_type:complete
MELQDYRDDLRERVVKIETIVQERVPRIDENISKIEQHFSVLNSRVRKLEDSKLQVYTIVGFISFFVPIVLKALEII